MFLWALVLLAFAGYLLAFLLPDFVRSSRGPQSWTMTEAAARATETDAYVTIPDGEWMCETITYLRGPSGSNRLQTTTRYTEVFRTDASGAVVVLAKLSGEVECPELLEMELSGYVQRMSAARQQELRNEARLARFFNATSFLEICGYCGPTNSLIGVLFGSGFALAGIVMLVWGFRMKRAASDGQVSA